MEAMLESTMDPVSTFNATIHQWYGDGASSELECASVEDLDRARMALERYEIEGAHEVHMVAMEAELEVSKAAANEVQVRAEDGSIYVIKVPSGAKQVHKSKDREKWLAADQKAHDAILLDPLNELVPETEPRSLGLPIAPCVTARSCKVDKDTLKLAENNGYKSRHAFDGRRHECLKSQKGIETFENTSATVADDMLMKMVLGDVPVRGRYITKCDIGDAYTKGQRLRAPTYMALPATRSASRIMFAYGTRDPWARLGVGFRNLSDSLPVVAIAGGSHCADVGGPDPQHDTPAMLAAPAVLAPAWCRRHR